MKTAAEVLNEQFADGHIGCGVDVEVILNAAGYVIVPKKSTHEMDTAGQSALKPRIPLSEVHGMYDAMLAAKP